MKPRLILFSLMASGLVAGLAVVTWNVWTSAYPSQTPEPLPADGLRPGKRPAREGGMAGQPGMGPLRQDLSGDMPAPVAGEAFPKLPQGLGKTAPPLLTESELRARVERVEQAANRDLQRLVSLLDLSETQQDRIFGTLARRSPDWHPVMQAVGVGHSGSVPPFISGSGPSLDTGAGLAPEPSADRPLLDDLADELTPYQQEALANAELDRIAWWEEIIPQLLPPDDTPALAVARGGDAPVISPGDGTAAALPAAPEAVKDGGEAIILD